MTKFTDRILRVSRRLLGGFLNWSNRKKNTGVIGYGIGTIVGFLLLRSFGVIALFSFLLGVVVCVIGNILFYRSPED